MGQFVIGDKVRYTKDNAIYFVTKTSIRQPKTYTLCTNETCGPADTQIENVSATDLQKLAEAP
jgi:hypothetical protein